MKANARLMRVRSGSTGNFALSRRGIQAILHAALPTRISGGSPELRGDGERIDPLRPPPLEFSARPMELVMVEGTKRYDKFVADFLSQAVALGKLVFCLANR